MGLLKETYNAQLAFSGQNTVAEALVASQGLGQGAVACSGRIRHAVSKIKQQFCVVMGLQKKTYNTQLTLPGHSTMAKALVVVAKAPGRVSCSEKGNWVL